MDNKDYILFLYKCNCKTDVCKVLFHHGGSRNTIMNKPFYAMRCRLQRLFVTVKPLHDRPKQVMKVYSLWDSYNGNCPSNIPEQTIW